MQCGLCVNTCPEKVITLEPRLNFGADVPRRVVVKEEEPFHCVRCAKPFGTRSSVERVKAKLGAHWMFRDPARLAVLEMCEDCRVFAATDGGIDPYGGPARAPSAPRTTRCARQERLGLRRADQPPLSPREPTGRGAELVPPTSPVGMPRRSMIGTAPGNRCR